MTRWPQRTHLYQGSGTGSRGDVQTFSDALMSREEVAAHLGIAPESVRSTLRRYGIVEQRGYPANQVLNLQRKPRGRTPKETT